MSSKSSLKDNVPAKVDKWDGHWQSILLKFGIVLIDDSAFHKCLRRVNNLCDVEIHDDIRHVLDFVDKTFNFNVSDEDMFKWRHSLTFQGYQATLKNAVKLCEDNIKTEPSCCPDLRMKMLSFVEEFKVFLHMCTCQRYTLNEAGVLSLFRSFAALANINFKPGAAIKRVRVLSPDGEAQLYSSMPQLRAFAPLKTENWNDVLLPVLAVAKVKCKPDVSLEDLKTNEHVLRSLDVTFSPHLRFSEKLLGSLLGEMILEYEESAFRNTGHVVGFGVQGTQVQLFVLKMEAQRYQCEDMKEHEPLSSLAVSPPLNILIREERSELLRCVATLASYGVS